MEKKISFGRITVPVDDYAIQGNAILGIRESGKSYTGTYCAERLMDAGIPITAIDPIGIWHSLRIAAKGDGYPVVVVGGKHGDLPLTPSSAEATMRAAMAAGVSIVFDLYDVKLSKKDWRDIVLAVVKVMLFENTDHGLRHVFIEEAPEFVPQKVGPEHGMVYSFVERLVRMGGNAGLGVTLIGQRAEEMNKAVLELCDCLFLHRQKGRRSLENLSKWLEVASPATATDVAAAVPSLKNGEACVWPRGAESPVRTTIPEKRTFHPDRRKRHMAAVAETKRMDAGEFVSKMKAELAKVEKKPHVGPFVEAALKALHGKNDRIITREEVDAKMLAERRIGFADGYGAAINLISPIVKNLRAMTIGLLDELASELAKPAPPYAVPTWAGTSIISHPIVKAAQRQANLDARDMVEGLSKPDRAVLTVLAQHARPMEKEELGILSGYSPNTGHFNNTVGGLRTRGYVTEGWPVSITSAGVAVLGPWQPLPKGADLREWWLERLGKPERLVLKAALEVYPEALTKGQLANRAGYQANTGHFTNTLGRLRTLRLLHGRHDIKASEVLFQ